MNTDISYELFTALMETVSDRVQEGPTAMERISSKFRDLELQIPSRLLRALALRLRHGLSVEDADSLGLLDVPLSMHRAYAFDGEREQFEEFTPAEEFRRDEEDKIRFAARLQRSGIRTPVTIGVIGDPKDTDAVWTGPVIDSGAALARLTAAHTEIDAICKPASGGQGWDILSFRVEGGTLQASGGIRGPDEFFEYIRARGYSRFCWILQQREVIHPELRDIMPGHGLGTIRIHSALSPAGDVLLRWPTLKIPGAGAVSDNWHVGRRGGMVAPVELGSGALGKAAGRPRPGARSQLFAAHPLTGACIEGRQLPLWPETRDLITRAARAFPELPALGWDVAITPEGPVVIEANWHFGFGLPQAAHRRGLRADFEAFFAFTR